VVTIFPHISIATFDAGGKVYMVSQLCSRAPMPTARSRSRTSSPSSPSEERQEAIAGTMAFLEHVVRDEDYYTGNRIQRSVKTGAKPEFLFGRNEGGGQRFHRSSRH
jgi:carnitine monooxygenase subunit